MHASKYPFSYTVLFPDQLNSTTRHLEKDHFARVLQTKVKLYVTCLCWNHFYLYITIEIHKAFDSFKT